MHACKVKVTGDPPCGMPGNAWRAKTIQVPCPAICLSVRWRPYGAPFFVQWASPGFPDTGGSPFSGPPRDPIGNSTLNASGTSLVRNRAAFCGIIAIVGFATGCVTSPPAPPRPPPPLWFKTGFPSLDGYYPADSLRNHEEGTALVGVCVSPNGQLAKPPKITRSSGSPRLDAAAIRYAYATSGHWVVTPPAGGPPRIICKSFPLRFRYPYPGV